MAEGVQVGRFVLGKVQRGGRHVLGEVVEVAGAGNGQEVRAAVQRPRQQDLGGA
uniref:hypothetical protein n=1 Tax=Streptomyces poonensis TaxID=68255 RepID=UPI003570CA55